MYFSSCELRLRNYVLQLGDSRVRLCQQRRRARRCHIESHQRSHAHILAESQDGLFCRGHGGWNRPGYVCGRRLRLRPTCHRVVRHHIRCLSFYNSPIILNEIQRSVVRVHHLYLHSTPPWTFVQYRNSSRNEMQATRTIKLLMTDVFGSRIHQRIIVFQLTMSTAALYYSCRRLS